MGTSRRESIAARCKSVYEMAAPLLASLLALSAYLVMAALLICAIRAALA